MLKWIFAATLICTMTITAQASPDPCKGDIETLCPEVEKGDGRVLECLRNKSAKVSPRCRAHWDTMKKEGQAIRKFCAEDRKKVCAEAKSRADIVKCLDKNKEKITAPCKTAIEKILADREG